MHGAVAALLARQPVDSATWRSFWDRLAERGLERGEPVALLASLATQLPDDGTLAAFLSSLDARRPPAPARIEGAVNIVGTGGGPPTFNVSTAAAVVAAAAGVPVVKTGSRAYTSALGSVDLLERLGVRLTGSPEATAASVDRFGIAFAGPYVYPRELALLARNLVPLGMRAFGRFLNTLGPFLGAVPVAAQVTGVSQPSLLPTLRALAASVDDRTVWLCANDHGTDELLGFARNVVAVSDGGDHVLVPGAVGPDAGGLDDLLPVAAERVVDHFLAVLAGGGGGVASDTVCLNAAALVIAGGHALDWASALASTRDAMHSGAARRLLDRMRADAPDAPEARPRLAGRGTSRPSPNVADAHSLPPAPFFRERLPERPGLALFLNAGDPPLARAADVVYGLDDAGVDCLELAVPFPDSVTDGPVIRRSAARALAAGVDLDDVLRFVAAVRPRLRHLRIALFVDWAHTVRRRSLPGVIGKVRDAGADGLLVHALPPRLRGPYHEAATATGLPVVTTCYRSSPPGVRAEAAAQASAYLYLVAHYGRSGSAPADGYAGLAHTLAELRNATAVPIAVGFGVGGAADVTRLHELGADAAVVGTAVVRRVERALAEGRDVAADVAELARSLRPAPVPS